MAKPPPTSGMTRITSNVAASLKLYRKELATYHRTARKAPGIAALVDTCSISCLIEFAVEAARAAIQTGTH